MLTRNVSNYPPPLCGEDIDLLAQTDALYQAAKAKHPERWSTDTRNW